MMDLHSRGANWRRDLMRDVDELILRRLNALGFSVAAQQEGVGVSDQHRVLNFQGAGVNVTDEPAARRTNIYIPGAAIAGSNIVTVVSTAGTEKVFALSGGSMAGAPASWQTTGFNDTSWSNSVQMTFNVSAFFTQVAGTQWVSNASGLVPTPAGCLVRRTFTLPSGTITSASLQINVDDDIGADHGLYINGTSIASGFTRAGSSTLAPATISISPSLFTAGGSNVLAVHVNDPNSGISSPHAVCYAFTITYTSTVAPAVNALISNVSLSSTNTWFDGPSLTLGSGTWFLSGSIDIQNNNASLGVLSARLWDGTTSLASGDQTPGANGGSASIAVAATVAPTGSTTYRIQGASQRTSCQILATNGPLGAANASYIMAVRMA